MKILCTVNGSEFTSEEFENYLKREGIKYELTIPKYPEQSGITKIFSTTLVEMIRLILADSKLPKVFCAKAVSSAVYLQN